MSGNSSDLSWAIKHTHTSSTTIKAYRMMMPSVLPRQKRVCATVAPFSSKRLQFGAAVGPVDFAASTQLLDARLPKAGELLGGPGKEVWDDMQGTRADYLHVLWRRTAKYSARETVATKTARGKTRWGDVSSETRAAAIAWFLGVSAACNAAQGVDTKKVTTLLRHDPTTVPVAVAILDWHIVSSLSPRLNADDWDLVCAGVLSVALAQGDLAVEDPETELARFFAPPHDDVEELEDDDEFQQNIDEIRNNHWKIAAAHQWNIMPPTPFELAFEMLAIILGVYPKPASFAWRVLTAVLERGCLHPDWVKHSAQPISLACAAIEVVYAIVSAASLRLQRSPAVDSGVVISWASERYSLYELCLFSQNARAFRDGAHALFQKAGVTTEPPPPVIIEFLAVHA